MAYPYTCGRNFPTVRINQELAIIKPTLSTFGGTFSDVQPNSNGPSLCKQKMKKTQFIIYMYVLLVYENISCACRDSLTLRALLQQ